MWNGTPFIGTKVALLCGSQIVVYLRDDKPDIPFPGTWDLPGGGREGEEDPVACGLREVKEEFGLSLSASTVEYVQRYPSQRTGGLDAYFCGAEITAEQIAQIKFGDEGQRWEMMSLQSYLDHDNAPARLQDRLRAFLLWRAGRA